MNISAALAATFAAISLVVMAMSGHSTVFTICAVAVLVASLGVVGWLVAGRRVHRTLVARRGPSIDLTRGMTA